MSQEELEELTRRLDDRIKRAKTLGEQLGASIQDWLKSNPLTAEPKIAEDRLSWELILRADAPPVEEWSSLFGDAVHNLRATLDNLAWGLATAGGAQPERPRQIQFPIIEDKTNWPSESRRIAELSLEAQQAIEDMQPFQRSGAHGTPQQDPLLLLSWLANIDKHRIAILPTMQPLELQHAFAVEFRTEQDASAEGPPQVEISLDPFTDGARLLRQVTKHPIVRVVGQCEVRAQVVVVDKHHAPLGVTEILSALAAYVPQVTSYVLTRCRRDPK